MLEEFLRQNYCVPAELGLIKSFLQKVVLGTFGMSI